MDAAARFERYVLEKGLRHTEQREKILEVFLKTERHVSTQELYDLVRRRHRGIGYATVARTVKLLEEVGISRQVDFGDGVQRYEHKWAHEHHDHLICIHCGSFVEIQSEQVEKLQDKLVRRHGYTQVSHKLDIFGVCPKCQRKRKTRK